jgi:hypothetical protein
VTWPTRRRWCGSADEVLAAHGTNHCGASHHGADHVDLVFGNAGIGGGGSFIADDYGKLTAAAAEAAASHAADKNPA